MTKNVLRLLAIVLLVSLLTPAATLAQFELEVVQAPKDYRDGSLTSLRPIRAADAEVIFVNGIDTEATEHKDGLIRVSNVFPDLDVIGIYNATDGRIPDIGQGLDDLRQALGVTRIGPINPAVEKLLSYLLLYDHEVTIVAHSQGAAITSAALMQFAMNYRERAERLHRVNVITLGGFAVSFPEGPQYLHMVFSSDPVPLFAESFCREERSDLAYRNYQQARYIVNDGPAPDPTNIPDFHCRFFEEVAVPHEHWQHGLGAYLNTLPTSAIQSLLAPQPASLKRVRTYDGIGQVILFPSTLQFLRDIPVSLVSSYSLVDHTAGTLALVRNDQELSWSGQPLLHRVAHYPIDTRTMELVRDFPVAWARQVGLWDGEGLVPIDWPPNVQPRDYTMWSDDLRIAVTLTYDGWEMHERSGMFLSLFTASGGPHVIDPAVVQQMQLPLVFSKEQFLGLIAASDMPDLIKNAMPGLLETWEGDIPLEYYYEYNAMYWVDNESGLVIDTAVHERRSVGLPEELFHNSPLAALPEEQRAALRIVVYDLSYQATDQTVQDAAEEAREFHQLSGGTDGTVQLWNVPGDITPPQTFESATVLEGHAGWVLSVAWSPDGTRLASGGYDYTVRVWDMTTGAALAVLDGHTSAVESVAWSPDGMRLASASSDGTMRVWDTTVGVIMVIPEVHSSPVQSVAWSPDGAWLASAHNDGTVQVWNTVTGAEVAVLEGHTGWVGSVAWSLDGTRLASSGGADSTVRVWNATTGAALAVLEGHTSSVESVAWSPDGGRLASASRDRTVRVWDVAMGTALVILEGHMDWVMNVAWSPDGGRLVSASSDRTVRVWDAATGATLAVLDGQTEGTLAVAWSPDGEWLATTGFHGTVRLWNVPGS